MNTGQPPIKNHRWARLLYGALIMVAVGYVYSWSIFATPFEEEFGWDAPTLSLNFSVLMFSFCFGGLLGAQLTERFSARLALLCAAAMTAAGFFGALLVTANSPWLLYLTFSLFSGLAAGQCYTVVMAALIPWFQDHIGLASGILLMAYSCATMLHGVAAAVLFARFGWRTTFVTYALVITTVLLAGMLLVRKPRPGELQEKSFGEGAAEAAGLKPAREQGVSQKPEAMQGQQRQREPRPAVPTRELELTRERKPVASARDFSTTQMLKTPLFYVYALWMLLVSSMGLALTGHINQLALSLGAAVALAVGFVSLYSVSNALGRVVMGVVFDRFGVFVAMLADALLVTAGAVLTLLSVHLSSIGLLAAAVILYSVGMSATPVCGSGSMAVFFGPTHYGTNLAVLNLTLVPAGFIGPSLMAFSMIGTGSYADAMTLMSLLGLVSVALVVIFWLLSQRFSRT
ncbi:MAG: MFS transporter [Coriobacteriales bacterium]|jgi:OFA family oxalate/formate antiporter-like MFS transporter|nr:MFS transporter [Coriobacteriales bacterium]